MSSAGTGRHTCASASSSTRSAHLQTHISTSAPHCEQTTTSSQFPYYFFFLSLHHQSMLLYTSQLTLSQLSSKHWNKSRRRKQQVLTSLYTIQTTLLRTTQQTYRNRLTAGKLHKYGTHSPQCITFNQNLTHSKLSSWRLWPEDSRTSPLAKLQTMPVNSAHSDMICIWNVLYVGSVNLFYADVQFDNYVQSVI